MKSRAGQLQHHSYGYVGMERTEISSFRFTCERIDSLVYIGNECLTFEIIRFWETNLKYISKYVYNSIMHVTRQLLVDTR